MAKVAIKCSTPKPYQLSINELESLFFLRDIFSLDDIPEDLQPLIISAKELIRFGLYQVSIGQTKIGWLALNGGVTALGLESMLVPELASMLTRCPEMVTEILFGGRR